ncbi:MAG: conjugal transfer protein TraW [Cellvibrionaceae bacterium]|nr:conjugal transfer protein TraW [Cellvibrionaceae bacterium]
MRFFKVRRVYCCLLWVLVNALVVSGANSQSVLTVEDKKIAEMADKIRAEAKTWDIPANPHQGRADSEAKKLVEQINARALDALPVPEQPKAAGRVLFFASLSLGPEGLEDLLYEAAVTEDALVVFRGVRDLDNFTESLFEIQRLSNTQSPVANVVIDPTLFRDHGIEHVPTIVYLNQDTGKEQARVAGLSNPKWLLDQVAAGKSGDFGTKGPLENILEQDLIELMKAKVATIDWEAKKEQAIQRFWRKQAFLELPKAPRARKREIDPSILIYEDMVDAQGNIIHPAGTVINPLHLQVFDQAVIVFDPQDNQQVDLVKRRLKKIDGQYTRITLIITALDTDDGWASYKKITDTLDAPVFKLTSDVLSRFELEYVPALVTANQDRFIVEELFIEE